jgi:hypothetical protein
MPNSPNPPSGMAHREGLLNFYRSFAGFILSHGS